MFVAKTPKENNDYANAIREALSAFKSDASLDYFIVTPEAFKRSTDYNAGGAVKGLQKQLAALGSIHSAAAGVDTDTGEEVAAVIFSK